MMRSQSLLRIGLLVGLGLNFGLLGACAPQADKPRSDKTLKDVLEAPPKDDIETIEARALEHTKSGALRFKSKTIAGMRDPFGLSRYICDGVEHHLENQFLIKQQFSNAFILSELKALPGTLQQTYATCHFEKGLKTLKLAAYFSEEKGFLADQALAGYKAFAAGPQAKLLTKAIELSSQKPKTTKAQQQLEGFWAELDKLWRKQDRKVLIRKRGDFIRARLDAGAWPVD